MNAMFLIDISIRDLLYRQCADKTTPLNIWPCSTAQKPE